MHAPTLSPVILTPQPVTFLVRQVIPILRAALAINLPPWSRSFPPGMGEIEFDGTDIWRRKSPSY